MDRWKALLVWHFVLLTLCVTEMRTSNDFVMPDDSSEAEEDLIMGPHETGGAAKQSDVGYPSYMSPEMIEKFGRKKPHTGHKDFKNMHELKHPSRYSYSGEMSGPTSDSKSCPKRPRQPINASMRYSTLSNSWQATCLRDYLFPNGETTLFISCVDGKWTIKESKWDEIPSCEPVCMPSCKNNGICLRPGECACPENFVGPQCEQEKKLCVSPPSLPKNSKRSCSSTACTITCANGYRFPDGTSITNMVCNEGKWTPTRPELERVPDCQPVCTPQCQNGGHCLSYNVCQCPPTHRGPQCQYDVETCSPKHMLFNGAYNCSGDNNEIRCILTCPQGVEFDVEPAAQYTCKYESGRFEPTTIPKCQFTDDMEIIPLGGTSNTFYKTSDQTYKSGSVKKKKKKKRVYYGGDDDDDEGSWEKTIVKTKIKIKKGKKSRNKAGYYETEEYEDEEESQMPGVYSMYMTNDLDVTFRTPKPAVCTTWNGNKIKTFDGLMYTSNLYCSHTLVQDYLDGSFSIILRACPYEVDATECPYALEIFLESLRYTFDIFDGAFRLSTKVKQLPIPSQLAGMRVTMVGHNLKIALDSVGVSVFWDAQRMVSIEVTAGLWNRTAGLCGTLDQDIENEFKSKDGTQLKMASTFVDSWKASAVDVNPDKCLMDDKSSGKMELECSPETQREAESVCNQLINTQKFSNCLKEFNADAMLKACTSDYCYCSDAKNPTKCACDGISVFAKDCQFRGIMLDHGWRDMELCPMVCKHGRVYQPCGPSFEPSCGSTTEEITKACTEGCFCPAGTLQHNGKCIEIESCPCTLRSKTFKPGQKITKDCNTCECTKGLWKCSDLSCGARCGAIGDPHLLTFDGKRYDFMGKCSYYLLKNDNFTIEAENVACPGSISEFMNFGSSGVDMPSCTKSVTINILNDGGTIKSIKLKQGRAVLVDDMEISRLPIRVLEGMLSIRQASSTMLLVAFRDGLRVWWDGQTRVYIDAPASYRGKTKGLCGTFNANNQDDFLTPEGDVESSVAAFTDKWRTKETCEYASNGADVPHPCQLNIENKDKAIAMCQRLKGKIFDECHWSVDPEPFYEDCMYDVCACKGDVSACLCPVFAAYATECSRQGTVLNWRHTVSDCAVNCPAGQIFEECGDDCFRTCEDLQFDEPCTSQCVEGCRCPPGQSLNDHSECIPTAQCSCFYKGLTFNAGYKEVRPGNKFLEICTCSMATWKCKEAADGDNEKYPAAGDLRSSCDLSENQEFTTCEPAEPITCKNMHSYLPSSTAECKAGCVCKKGYVMDIFDKRCVLPKNCACHHGSKSYADGEAILNECNNCKCKAGAWDCTKDACPATCTTWGDSHFETYDGKDFDFQGVCNYVLSKGMLDGGDGFAVTIQNVLCGSLGVTCSKAITIDIVGKYPETITLSSDQAGKAVTGADEAALIKLSIHTAGLFTVIEAPGMELQIKWDRGTRVYVKLGIQWKGRVQGLCGNFNGDTQDDLKTPSSGIETSAIIFGDSWKLQDFCEKPTEQIDTCQKHPERKTWAQRQCGLLKSDTFKACHSEVSVEKYMKRCTYDTCACDQGGDCECLCTAIAAYAHACSMKGVSIKWRTPTMCPMQCDPHCSEYTPCLSTCPVDTCDNVLDQAQAQRMCVQDTCVEGCLLKPCPDGEIYKNNTFAECVPKAVCKHVCLVKNDVTYYEGDTIASDACHTCRCVRGKELCSGVPCPKTPAYETTTIAAFDPFKDKEHECRSGWSEWINQDKLDTPVKLTGLKSKTKSKSKSMKIGDVEPIPSQMVLCNLVPSTATCSPESIKKVECRTVDTRLSPKETGEDVECSLEKGLLCVGPCHDYEIRVMCDCGDEIEIFTVPTTEPHQWDKTPQRIVQFAATTQAVPVNTKCDPTIPHVAYPGDCHRFLHCEPSGTDGSWSYAEKTCGTSMMFNPKYMVCDWPASVISSYPDCGKEKQPKLLVTTVPPTNNRCPVGKLWSECALPCGKACHFYGTLLTTLGKCTHASNQCEEGCVDEATTLSCPRGQLWRDNKMCVGLADCTCMSRSGDLVKPGSVVRESDCEVCQCIDNAYVCDASECTKHFVTIGYGEDFDVTVKKLPIRVEATTWPTILVPSTVSPPPKCNAKNWVPMIEGENPLTDTAFSCSSYLGSSFKAKYSRLNSKPTSDSSGSWSPEANDQTQYLQITFEKPVALYAVIVRGSPTFDQYVTSFMILHSFDGVAFHELNDHTKAAQIFRGPIDAKTPVESAFKIPIEAKVVRVYPLTWHVSIAMRVELLGCDTDPKRAQETQPPPPPAAVVVTTSIPEVLTTAYTEHIIRPLCDEPMGVETGIMRPNQVEVSSAKSPFAKTIPSHVFESLKLNSLKGWSPNLDTPSEFVLFDFLEPRYVTGMQTKGGEYGWVTGYTVLYSLDKLTWNPIQNFDGEKKQFLGNYDSYSTKLNAFDLPIHARYVKLVPTKWHNAIELKVEPIGCFKPYPLEEFATTTLPSNEVYQETTKPECGVCANVLNPPSPIEGTCRCYPPLYWNGNECTPKSQCPCMVGHIAYDVGAQYELDDCSTCVCVLGGNEQCKPQTCSCAKGLRPVKSATCRCLCEPCPVDQVLCETTGACIPEASWCDGIQDCPDDEVECAHKEKETPKVVTQVEEKITIIKTCPEPSCPPGFTIKEHKSKNDAPIKKSPMFQQSKSTAKSNIKTAYKKPSSYNEVSALPVPKTVRHEEPDEQCIEFICLPEKPKSGSKDTEKTIKCPEPQCPKGYEVLLDNELSLLDKCAKFTCEPTLQEDSICNVTGRTFNTFDGTEFKYDICNHLLARDLTADKWAIVILKNCTYGNYICKKELKIQDKETGVTVVLYTDLTLSLDGYRYTVEQLQKSTYVQMKSFVVSKVGNTIVFVSHLHGFWVIFDEFGDVKIGVSAKHSKTVDGLCGYFNGNSEDDKRLPTGDAAPNTVDFGDGWYADADAKQKHCEPHACPKNLQDIAWEMCATVRHESFGACGRAVDTDRFISKCLETACDCLMVSSVIPKTGATNEVAHTPSAIKACKCAMLQNYVVDCMAADEDIHLDTWRMVHDCAAECVAPLVHNDCYRRRCEPTCATVASDECPHLPGTCFSGCYCPSGYVKQNEICVPLSDCRDCVCDGFGNSQYVTYDRKNFTFDGNCTYLLSRDLLVPDVHTFQVYATLGPCEPEDSVKSVKSGVKPATCTHSLHILYGSHIVHLQKGPGRTITTLVDGIKVTQMPLKKEWIDVQEAAGRDIRINLPESQVELSAAFDDMSFAIRVPSVKYGLKMEGLCGDCNGDASDDLRPNPKVKAVKGDAVKDIVETWLADDPALPKEEECVSEETAETDCIPLPPEEDPCFQILDEALFGSCNMIVDPYMHLSSCQTDMCRTGPNQEGACKYVSAYAKECSRNNICVDWRRGKCAEEDICPVGMAYASCGCPKTCETVKQAKERQSAAKLSSGIASAKPDEICMVSKTDGCFCPDGKVAHNGSCILEKHCIPCDDALHYPGDAWYPDKCTECTCNEDSNVMCTKRECSLIGSVCEFGWRQIVVDDPEECCPVFKCVPEMTEKPELMCNDNLPLPDCGADQQNKQVTDSNGCRKYICECKPYDQCKPLVILTLKPGEKMVTDTTGCCPVHKLFCDKSKCPVKPVKCDDEFYEVVQLPATDPDQCCEEFECRPPKGMCLVEIDGKKYLKVPGEKWPTSDACLTKVCSYGPDGETKVLEELEQCSLKVCELGAELKPDKCCGICVQTKCVFDKDLYAVGQEWTSSDNCTTYKCIEMNDQYVVTSMKETCPDISECPDNLRYFKGCCQLCKTVAEEQKNCVATSLSDAETTKLVVKPTKLHGMCRNMKPIRGFTECNGACSSGTRYNQKTYKQTKKCDCCSVSTYDQINVPLTCDNGFELDLVISVPKACTCQPCYDDVVELAR